MKALRRFLTRLAAFTTGRRDKDRLREELEEHVALQTADNIRSGMSPADARRQAVLKLGGVEAIREGYHDEQGLPVLDSLLQDATFALRQLRKTPLFALAAVASLALGIGVNVAVFTLIERLLLARLPVPNPQELVILADQRGEGPNARFSYPFYTQLRDNDILKGTAARFVIGLTATASGEPTTIRSELVSGNYFNVLGVSTQIGRPLTPEEDRVPGAHPVVVISDGFWRRSFGADPAVLGRTIQLNTRPFTIIGVAPRSFSGTDTGFPTDVWLPMTMQREAGRDFLDEPRTNWVEVFGRLPSSVDREAAAAGLSTYLERHAPGLQQTLSERRLRLIPGDKGSSGVRREVGPALRVLQGLGLLALALACVNVASLLAVRSASREKEIAIRLALGAGRSRLAQQFLTESLILAAAGGAAAIIAAPSAAQWFIAAQSFSVDLGSTPTPLVLLFAIAISALAALFVGQAPILLSRKVGVGHASAAPMAMPPERRLKLHDAIVSVQIGLSLAMLISAALLTQSLRGLSGVDPGFRADNVIVMSLNPAAAGYRGDRLTLFWQNTLEWISVAEGVQAASLARIVPMGQGLERMKVFEPASGTFLDIDSNNVGPRYFTTLGIPVLRGREFDQRDRKGTRDTVIVNERLAAMLWPGADPIGKELRAKGLPGGGSAEVIGLVRDVKYRDLRGEFGPIFYRALLQSTTSDGMTLHVRSAGDPSAMTASIRRMLQSLDDNVPVSGVTTLTEQLSASFAQTRQAAVLAGVFGLLALALSGVGVYGVTALTVSRRTREIGIRMALGAQPSHIVRVVGWRGVMLTAVGLLLGIVGSLAFTRIAAALLYGITARDAATFVSMSALLAAVSAVAFWIPARAATRLDAVAAIRRE
jgi:predicted permease